ncbi:hypothetical protein EV182_000063 [Spiromyces aspiralis]|uniref:Uncharacterized protein n=1 Tax=Spiromyces aspiralis TaxID=68401 RepID=A0ACC1HZ49_9FUNG|nr:hypothetical protein EV182_000063 [Spiromyces aspiralis]
MVKLTLPSLVALYTCTVSSALAQLDAKKSKGSSFVSEAELPEFKPYVPTSAYFWEQFTDETSGRWMPSKAKKAQKDEDESEDLLRYDGRWEIEEAQVISGIRNKKSLVLKSPAKHHAISVKFNAPIAPNDKPFVLQYEVKLQNSLECGGAYVKLLTSPAAVHAANGDEKTAKADLVEAEFTNDTPYTIMFGPDKCGDSKVHFIFRHLNPKTNQFEEKHLRNPPLPKTDKLTHLYTLIVTPDNKYRILIDDEEATAGSLFEDFVPPVNPPKEIDDPSDKKPSDWVDEPEIPDPDARKPDDWDEDAPLMIPDEDAVKPDDWYEDEPLMVSDPNAKKPEDWNDEEDGDWIPPSVSNPKCEDAAGCGPWERPMKHNPNYKGKWEPPLIKNPDYKGEWKHRRIPNPDYYEDKHPSRFAPMSGIGFEIWTMQNGITFDNIYVGESVEEAGDIAKKVWKPKHDSELKVLEAEKAEDLNQDTQTPPFSKPLARLLWHYNALRSDFQSFMEDRHYETWGVLLRRYSVLFGTLAVIFLALIFSVRAAIFSLFVSPITRPAISSASDSKKKGEDKDRDEDKDGAKGNAETTKATGRKEAVGPSTTKRVTRSSTKAAVKNDSGHDDNSD